MRIAGNALPQLVFPLLLLIAISGHARGACLASVAPASACLDEVDSTVSLANRLPLILVHGWNPESIPGPALTASWNNFVAYYNSPAGVDLKRVYKLYRFSYLSNAVDLATLGGALRDVVDAVSAADAPGFGSKRIAIVGHSLGGLIARDFMGFQQLQGLFAGRRAGERVLRLITLGTPHHGSPAANGPARDAKAGPDWTSVLHEMDTRVAVAYNQVNRSDMWWVNYPGGFQLDYQTYPAEQNGPLIAMNGDSGFDQKIIAYAGSISNGTICFTNDMNCLYYWSSYALNGAFNLPNDGIVPVVSAQFATHNIARRRLFSGYNHSQLAAGKSATDTTVFDLLRTDLSVQTASHDFDGHGKSDIAWRQNGGTAAIWLMSGAQITSGGSLGVVANPWSLVGQRDFDGDGKSDWLWRDATSGTVAIWLLDGLQILQTGSLGAVSGNWSVAGIGDFDGDGRGDIAWRDAATGAVAVWLLNGLQIAQTASLGAVPSSWSIGGLADFDGDGKADILWRDSVTGAVAIWLMNGTQVTQAGSLASVAANWSIAGTGDFDGDGKADILWRDSNTGAVAIWLVNGLQVVSSGALGSVAGSWLITETGDFDGDGKADILWRDTTSGAAAIWFVNGVQVSSSAGLGTVSLDWTMQILNAD